GACDARVDTRSQAERDPGRARLSDPDLDGVRERPLAAGICCELQEQPRADGHARRPPRQRRHAACHRRIVARMTASSPNSSPNSVVRAVLVAGAVTLIVTLVRLIGELSGWAPVFFSKKAGGGFALVGISWLVAPFGFWFGRLIARAHGRPRMGRAWLLTLGPIALFLGVVFTVRALRPDDLEALGPVLGLGAPLAALSRLFGWPRCSRGRARSAPMCCTACSRARR